MVPWYAARARRLRGLGMVLLIAGALLAAAPLGTPAAPASNEAEQAADKLVLAFYFPWYGKATFGTGQMADQPVAPYDSGDTAVITRQVREAQGAGIDAFISSWQGTGSVTDQNFAKLLDIAAAQHFRAALYFETNYAQQQGDVAGQLQAALTRYANHPAYLRWHGKPVVFFWAPGALGDAAAWQRLRRQVDPNQGQIWSVDTVDPRYLDAFDTIHLFSAGKWTAATAVAPVDAQWRKVIDDYNRAHGTQRLWAAGVIPGWDESRVQPPRPDAKVFPRGDGALYGETWQAAVASKPDWITITSYNEWFEGTQIEPSATYGTRYLDLTRQYATQWKGAPPAPPTPGPADPCAGGTAFPQTGHSICKPMESYWRQYGGLAQFGYPIGDWLAETSPTDGKRYTVQYFERARFELHPENADARYAVLLGLLGTQFHRPDPRVTAAPNAGGFYFAQTGHNVSAVFYQYWQAHGGLFVNGYPISEEFAERSSDGKTYRVQYFERARYELHPENAPPYNVLLGFLGRQAWDAR
jgi:hypothetical protein